MFIYRLRPMAVECISNKHEWTRNIRIYIFYINIKSISTAESEKKAVELSFILRWCHACVWFSVHQKPINIDLSLCAAVVGKDSEL